MKEFEVQMYQGNVLAIAIGSKVKDFTPKIIEIDGKKMWSHPAHKEAEIEGFQFLGPTSMSDEELMDNARKIVAFLKDKKTRWKWLDGLHTRKTIDTSGMN